MTVSSRQFNHLTEMGIQLWQRKSLALESAELEEPDQASVEICFSSLLQSQFFLDILSCLNVSQDEVIQEKNTLRLGLFNWNFTLDNSIDFKDNTLFTPELSAMTASKLLKAQLWQTIVKNNLL